MDKKQLLNAIPKVDEILNTKDILDITVSVPRHIVADATREVLENVREDIINDKCDTIDIKNIICDIKDMAIQKNRNHLRRVINASGIIIHTNLGRSLLCSEAIDAVSSAARHYCNLEFDIEKKQRGSRYSHIEWIIREITGAESAMAVNNNAAAVLLALSTLCKNREAVVSRGELVEIGGSFRIPDVMELSGAKLIEVGTTNRTHLYDYENAISENTGALLKIHTSNYRIVGFTESVSGRDIAPLAHKNDVPVIMDIGSGNFVDFTKYGISGEPTVQDAIKSGIDIVTFSGDKMLGGPQAGLIVGKKKYIDLMKKNPLTRAVRLDKMTIAALEATLRKYLDIEDAVKTIPTLRMITLSADELEKKAVKLLNMIKNSAGDYADLSIMREYSEVGGGSMPLENLPTFAVSIKPLNITINELEKGLRNASIPIIARTYKDSLLMDARTIGDDEFNIIADTLYHILRGV
ncbi:MAG: L-seryl-tRNA(Sec) selenium transferase [Clostridiales bacterium]|nr:L-seryl-tRNA(Sec) selenium transferase [Clostridiales bacterium]